MRTLENNEIEQVSGGIWAHVLAAIAVYDAATDFVEGFKEGYENAEPRKL
ncbi:class IIb bacteriocin, lactobin A/cerein 7B family [uncultured Stenotrophomonas sp.]|nr:class IIb bacteriocin, lactobin A/cerein 7B family [uncultured Stenotrophomonas sp.]